jgi:hypothetical protein
MSEKDRIHKLSSMPPPQAPHDKKKGFFKKPLTLIIGFIGVVASTSTVIGLVRGWFSNEPDAVELAAQSTERLAKIEKKLDSRNDDTHLVNQVSRRVTAFSDRFAKIRSRMKDIIRLESSLGKQAKAGGILTPDQKKLILAGRKKETEELLSLVRETEKKVTDFIEAVRGDQTLSLVSASDSVAAEKKAAALAHLKEASDKMLPELKRLKNKYGG